MSDQYDYKKWKKEAEENDEELRIMFSPVLSDPETWELKLCDKCIQMTNHDKDGCLKCRAKAREK